MKIKNSFDLYNKDEIFDFRGIVILGESGQEAFEITMKDGALHISGMTNLKAGIRGTLVVKPVAANVISVRRE